MIHFENTGIAFADKSNAYLRKAKWIFKIMSRPFIVKIGSALLQFAIKIRLPISWIVKPTVFNHFCGGETIQECEKTIGKLSKSGVQSILDYSAEGLESEKGFDDTFKTIISIIDKAAENEDIPFAVFKPTGIARFDLLVKVNSKEKLTDEETAEFNNVKSRFSHLSAHAASKDVPLMVDAEESWIQDIVDKLVENEIENHNTKKPLIFNTVQLYRKDRLEYMKNYCQKAWNNNLFPAFKLVRGAYLEKERERAEELNYPSPVHDNKYNTDKDFDAAVKFCLDNSDKMATCIGTHNEESVGFAVAYMQDMNVPKNNSNIYFSQLLGMSDNISYGLANQGFNVTKYVPYGPLKLVMPYLIRRAEENTSVAGQTSRELQLIKKELKRRKNI